MKVIPTAIPEVLLVEPRVFGDERGFFFESYNERQWREKTGLGSRFVQHNHSRSARHVLRGLHYQISQPQGKLVRVIRGEVYDVAVDLRRSSATFGRWVGEFRPRRTSGCSGCRPGLPMVFWSCRRRPIFSIWPRISTPRSMNGPLPGMIRT